MGRQNIVSLNVITVLCTCAAMAMAGPVFVPEEDMLEEIVVVLEDVFVETTTADIPTIAPADPKLTLDLPQIPNNITKNTLISTAVLVQLGAVDTNSDEDIDLNGTTPQPPPHLTVEVLPGSVAETEEKEAIEASKAETTTQKTDKVQQDQNGKADKGSATKDA